MENSIDNVVLEVSNSLTTVKASNEICSNIYNLLSYKTKDAFFVRKNMLYKWRQGFIFKGMSEENVEKRIEALIWIRLYNRKSNTFPTGLISKVQNHLKEIDVKFIIHDKRKVPKSTAVFRKVSQLPPLRYYQSEAVDKGLAEGRGIFEMATGCGKSNIIIELTYRLKVNTLIVVPSSTILIQFFNNLVKVFGKNKVGMITGGKKNLNKPITVATYQSLPNIDKEWFDKIDCLILDEAHHGSAETILELNKEKFNSIYYRFFFTGTAYRNDGKDMSLEAVISDKFIYEYSTVQGIKDKFLVPVYFYIYDFAHECSNDRKKYRKELDDLIIDNEKYNNFIVKKAIQLDKKGISTIIFVDQIKHGEYFKNNIPGSVFAQGDEKRPINMKAIDDFNKGKFNILIGTTVIGEGVDTVRGRCGIFASGGKAQSAVVQKIGRVLRPCQGKEFSFIIDFTHRNSKYMEEHFLQRLAIYKDFMINGNEIVYQK